jgi:hypothetical protein
MRWLAVKSAALGDPYATAVAGGLWLRFSIFFVGHVVMLKANSCALVWEDLILF